MTRPTWEDYFLEIAKVVATRSHDEQTQHGCVLVKDNRIIGTGYNGVPRGMSDDNKWPKTRPTTDEEKNSVFENKYWCMMHSERNALLNRSVNCDGIIAYVTGEPCLDCLLHMWQGGVYQVVYIQGHGSYLITQVERERRDFFLEQSGMQLIPVTTVQR